MLLFNRLRFIFVLAIFPLMLTAQIKVLESSEKKIPDWVNATITDYIITYAEGKDIDEAKLKLVAKLKTEIVNSVASYVRSTSEINIENVNRDRIVNTLEMFKQTATIQTADVPFLKGISLNKAEGYYWEKTQNKGTGVISYTYHVKYPFSKAELHRLIMEFNKRDQEMTNKMSEIIESTKNATAIETIEQNKEQLQQLANYFIDSRKETAQLEIKHIDELLKQVDINMVENTPGRFVYNLVIGGKVYTSAQSPRFTNSPCIKINSRESNEMNNEILYSYENCYEKEDNFISFSYKFGNNKVSKQYSINITSEKVEIFIKDPVRLFKLEETDKEITSLRCNLPVIAKYEGTFTIDKIELEFPGKPLLVIEGDGKVYTGKGVHDVVMLLNKPIAKEVYTAISGIDISGIVYYTDIKNKEQKRYKIFYHKLTTDW